MSQSAAPLHIRPLDAALGAVIGDLDVRHPDAATQAALRAALLEHLVLILPGQQLAVDEVGPVIRRFGTPLISRELNRGKIADPVYDLTVFPPEITAISNLKMNGQAIGHLGDAEVVWHSDHSYAERPAAIRMLAGHEVPPPAAGGNTGFLNLYAAYATLPRDLKQAVHGRSIKHDNAISVTLEWRADADRDQPIDQVPGMHHPIVVTHPETGCNSLFLGRRARAHVDGMSVADSEALLDALWAHATQERFCIEHVWSQGDMVIWDNRATLHRRGSFDPAARRLLYAAQVEGERPVEAADARQRPAHPRYRPV